ncbi:hypothetical protein ABW21_db0200522 [Orbilia brochopaga]|nr:hypothetical protein ABW21_db0200522 [Drechslerella brochopaga]
MWYYLRLLSEARPRRQVNGSSTSKLPASAANRAGIDTSTVRVPTLASLPCANDVGDQHWATVLSSSRRDLTCGFNAAIGPLLSCDGVAMQQPETPRCRFPSPDDTVQPSKSASAAVKQPQFATPAPLTARRQQDVNIATTARRQKAYNRGVSPDPDLYLSTPRVATATSVQSKNKRRRSFDLDEIDEALMTSGRPKVLGPSSSGWKGACLFNATPTLGQGTGKGKGVQTTGHLATPTPASRTQQQQPPALFQRASTILSSPPPNPELSFGDTQEDVQDDSEEGAAAESGGEAEVKYSRRQSKRRKSAGGVFDDIESIASSLPNGLLREDDGRGDEEEVSGTSESGEEEDEVINVDDDGEEDDRRKENQPVKGKEKATPRITGTATTQKKIREEPLTPPRFRAPTQAVTGAPEGTTGTAVKQWITVPNQPQLNLPPQRKSPSAKKLDEAICTMAWSPSHRRRRNANAKYPAGGLAATVLGWAYDAQDAVLRTNAAIEHQQQQQGALLNAGTTITGRMAGVSVVSVEALWQEENYVAVVGGATTSKQPRPDEQEQEVRKSAKSTTKSRVVLVGDANSALRRELRAGSRVEVRPPTWEMHAGGHTWTVVVNWKADV